MGQANTRLIKRLVNKQRNGDKVILNTCRRGEELKKAVEYSRANGLVYDSVNENLPEVIERYGGDTRKIYADVYYDDKNAAGVLLRIMYIVHKLKERFCTNGRRWKEQKEDTLKIYSQIENIEHEETIEGLDIKAGYIMGIVEEKVRMKKITWQQKEAVMEILEQKRKDVRMRLERE